MEIDIIPGIPCEGDGDVAASDTVCGDEGIHIFFSVGYSRLRIRTFIIEFVNEDLG